MMREELNPYWGGGGVDVDFGVREVWSGLGQVRDSIGTDLNRFGGGGEIRAWKDLDLCKESMARGMLLSESTWAGGLQAKRLNGVEDFRVSGVECGNGIGVKLGKEVKLSEGLGLVSGGGGGGGGGGKKGRSEEGEFEKEEGELEEGEIVDLDEVTDEGVDDELKAMEIDSCLPPPTSIPSVDDSKHIASASECQVSHQEFGSSRVSVRSPISTGVLKLFSSYQNTFGSFERLPSPTPSEDHGERLPSPTPSEDHNERLPSPTPSEDHEGKDDDCSREVSTSVKDKSQVNSSLLQNSYDVPSKDIDAVERSGRLVTSSAVSSRANSRDPRLRYAWLDVGSIDLPQPPLIVGNKASTAAPVGGSIGLKSKLNRSFEGSNMDCPPTKRQRNSLLNYVRNVNSNAGNDGLLNDNGLSGTMPSRETQIKSVGKRLRDPRTALAACSNGAVKTNKKTVPAIDKVPTLNLLEMAKNTSVNSTMSFPMGGNQQSIIGKPLQKHTCVTQLKPRDPRHALFASMSQSAAMPMHCSAETQKRINAQVSKLRPCIKPVSSQKTTPDITRKDTGNLKNVDSIIASSRSENTPSVASQNQSSVSTLAEMKTDDFPLPEVAVAGGSNPHNTSGDVEYLFDGYDDHERALIEKERARRLEEQKKMFAERKLCLVLDLDHTLLNSVKFSEIDPAHDDLLRKKEEQDRDKPHKHLFRLPHMGLWTKLRPGIWNFLEKASKLCELHVCTMGNKSYASEMAKILDPEGVLFAGRVISRGDDEDIIAYDDKLLKTKTKDLEGVLGLESSVVILDDTIRVWPHNKKNLIAVERYIYFPCSRRQFGLPGPSLLEIDHDERPEDGTLASCLTVIERLHETFFSHQNLNDVDVRTILANEQRKILSGCRIVFSCVFPVAETNPHLHPLWQLAEQFGASCTNQIDDQVTHVVANSLGTSKVNWALSTGRFVVRPNWLEASALLYRRANEQDFTIKP